jgi:hypothetical protein
VMIVEAIAATIISDPAATTTKVDNDAILNCMKR